MDSHNRVLPVFPLPLVQFPGALTPLHIFEPRYRKMLRDVLAGDRTFGIILERQTEPGASPEVRVGCSVEVVDAAMIADGRSNILCRGIQRFRVVQYIDGEPYLQAEVEFFEDELAGSDLSEEANQARELLTRAADLGQRLGESRIEISMADDPGDAEGLSMIVSSCINTEEEQKQKLLEMVDTALRLEISAGWLTTLVEDYEKRLFAKEIAGKNGHHGRISMES